MTRLLCCFVILVVAEYALFSSASNKTGAKVADIRSGHLKKGRSGANCKYDPTYRYHIPYHLSEELPREIQDAVRKCFDEYITYTCFTFEEVESIDDIDSRFENGSGVYFTPKSFDFPYPPVVYLNNQNRVTRELSLCDHIDFNEAVARANQQMMYALGFYPQHKRPDRDKYVKVLWDNIDVEAGWKPEFEIQSDASTRFPFDYTSVANFYPTDGALPIQETLQSTTGTPVKKNTMLSPTDAFRINLKYCEKCI